MIITWFLLDTKHFHSHTHSTIVCIWQDSQVVCFNTFIKNMLHLWSSVTISLKGLKSKPSAKNLKVYIYFQKKNVNKNNNNLLIVLSVKHLGFFSHLCAPHFLLYTIKLGFSKSDGIQFWGVACEQKLFPVFFQEKQLKQFSPLI